jgi:tetratricopeptide (TPR) repeat protein
VTTQAAVAAQMRSELGRYPAGPLRPSEVDPQVAERLAALGYVGKPRDPGTGPLPNPRDNLPALGAIREAARLAADRRDREAVSLLRGLLDKNPAMIDVWMKLGDLHLSMGRPADAATAYGQALRRGPLVTADMVLALGQAELLRGRLDQAEAAARRALPSLPGRAHVLLARVALGRNRLDEALSEADAARQADPQPSSDLLRAEVLLRRNDPAGALAQVEAAARRATELRMASVYGLEFVRADAQARLNMTDAAEAAYQTEIAEFPDHLQAYANLAVLYSVQQKRDKVEPTLRQMVSANPNEAARALAVKTLETLGEKQAAAAFRRRDSPRS